MASFLRQILETLSISDTSSLKDACFVFPSRRACYYFKEELRRYYPGSSFILPEIVTIEDFVIQHSGKVIPDELSLILQLHGLFNEVQPQNFEDFYPWGKMVLRDFEEIDKYLVDAHKLYQVLQEHREIEEAWALDESALQSVREFWDNVDGKNPTEHKEHFLQTWHLLGTIYTAFREKLERSGTAHMGMAYRTLADSLLKEDYTLSYSLLVFAGFNALSVAEERIFSACLARGKTHLFWDADQYYLDDPQQEAGNFVRHYRSIFQHPNCHWIVEDLIREYKNIRITGIPSLTGQAQTISQLLANEPPDMQTAIVLCDEQLLMPLLHGIPAQKNGINITMGYPVKHCIPYQLIEICFHLYNQQKSFSGQTVYFYKGINALTGHTLIQQWIGADIADKISDELTRHNRIWASLPWIKEKTGLDIPQLNLLLGNTPEDGTAFGARMAKLFETLLQLPLAALDAHVCRSLQDEILRFNAILSAFGHTIPLAPYYKILRQLLHAGSIPFEGSDTTALQIMGFLETRLLDFEQVIVLSANEQYLPAPNRHRSFIPYHLRKGFGMSTFEEQDAIYAYHFYRLIQRTKVARLYYNTSGNNSDQEPSRYILQLRREHPFVISGKDSGIPAQPLGRKDQWARKIIIPKNEKTIALLQRRKFSASSLFTYLTCPVQFYLQYIAGLKEEDEEVSETMDNRVMGQILHKAMELVYSPWLGREIIVEDLEKIRVKGEIDKRLQQAFNEELGESSLDIAEGKNYLIFEVLKDIVAEFLQWDISIAPFTILGLEESIIVNDFALGNGQSATLVGRLDRRDMVLSSDGSPCERVIDYKTGQVNIAPLKKYKSVLNPEEYTEQYFKQGSVFKEGFQGYFYNLLLQESSEKGLNRKVGFYSARNFSQGISYLQEGLPVPDENSRLFREMVAEIIREILDPNVPFTQSDKADAYKYSPFAELVPTL